MINAFVINHQSILISHLVSGSYGSLRVRHQNRHRDDAIFFAALACVVLREGLFGAKADFVDPVNGDGFFDSQVPADGLDPAFAKPDVVVLGACGIGSSFQHKNGIGALH